MLLLKERPRPRPPFVQGSSIRCKRFGKHNSVCDCIYNCKGPHREILTFCPQMRHVTHCPKGAMHWVRVRSQSIGRRYFRRLGSCSTWQASGISSFIAAEWDGIRCSLTPVFLRVPEALSLSPLLIPSSRSCCQSRVAPPCCCWQQVLPSLLLIVDSQCPVMTMSVFYRI